MMEKLVKEQLDLFAFLFLDFNAVSRDFDAACSFDWRNLVAASS
jgi:hypothetical protein